MLLILLLGLAVSARAADCDQSLFDPNQVPRQRVLMNNDLFQNHIAREANATKRFFVPGFVECMDVYAHCTVNDTVLSGHRSAFAVSQNENNKAKIGSVMWKTRDVFRFDEFTTALLVHLLDDTRNFVSEEVMRDAFRQIYRVHSSPVMRRCIQQGTDSEHWFETHQIQALPTEKAKACLPQIGPEPLDHVCVSLARDLERCTTDDLSISVIRCRHGAQRICARVTEIEQQKIWQCRCVLIL